MSICLQRATHQHFQDLDSDSDRYREYLLREMSNECRQQIMLTKYPFDILAINETKLDSSILDSEINIDGCIIIRKDRNRNGGGIAIYIRNNISCSERIDLTLGLGNLEMICTEINKVNFRSFLISALVNLCLQFVNFTKDHEQWFFKGIIKIIVRDLW